MADLRGFLLYSCFNYTTSAMALSICPISFYNEPPIFIYLKILCRRLTHLQKRVRIQKITCWGILFCLCILSTAPKHRISSAMRQYVPIYYCVKPPFPVQRIAAAKESVVNAAST